MALYDRIGLGYDTTRRADPYLTERLRALLAPTAGDQPPAARYLDIACGSGNYTAALAATGLKMTGVDQSDAMLDQARAKHPEGDWQEADGARLPFPGGTFVGALCTFAVHHFQDPTAVFDEVTRLLTPGGRLVLLTSDPDQMRGYWLNAYFPKALAAAIAQMPSLSTITTTLREAGFAHFTTEPYAVRHDLQDHFLYSGKHRPALYLDPRVRAGISTFADLADPAEVDAGCAQLASDIDTGRIADVMAAHAHDRGDYTFLVATRVPIL